MVYYFHMMPMNHNQSIVIEQIWPMAFNNSTSLPLPNKTGFWLLGPRDHLNSYLLLVHNYAKIFLYPWVKRNQTGGKKGMDLIKMYDLVSIWKSTWLPGSIIWFDWLHLKIFLSVMCKTLVLIYHKVWFLYKSKVDMFIQTIQQYLSITLYENWFPKKI